MKFSWLDFCKTYGIAYVDQGTSVSKGHIAARCPFCSSADPSQHMGLKLDHREPYWGCWRDPSHRGRDPTRLIAAFLDCSFTEARAILTSFDQSGIDAYEEMVNQLHTQPPREPKKPAKPQTLMFPHEFRQLRYGEPASTPFLNYLARTRGFDQIDNLAWYYDLHYAVSGPFSGRVIIPFFFNNRLVGWTGRHVGSSPLRYKTLSDDAATAAKQGSEPAPINPKAIVFNHTNAEFGGRTLFVCEGPIDAIKLDWYGGHDVCAVACLGMPEPRQLLVIGRLSEGFEQVCVALDNDSLLKSDALQEELQSLCRCPVLRVIMPRGTKDPGEFQLGDVKRLVHTLRGGHVGSSWAVH